MTDLIDIKEIQFPKGCPKFQFYRHPEYYELTCSIFTKCNLNCEFCSQEHAEDLDEEYLMSIPELAYEATKDDFAKYASTLKKIEVRFWGGELYSDNIPFSYFIKYQNFVEHFRYVFNSYYPNLEIEFITTTNGVLLKRDRLAVFLRNVGIQRVSVSFDYLGRYRTEQQKQMALDTMKYLADEGFEVNVGIILTKRSINYILEHQEEFKELFTRYSVATINFNFYVPNEGWEVDMPSDDDMFEMYKFCIDNRLFGIKTVYYLFETWLTKEFMSKECECKFLPNIFKGGTSKNCIQCFSNLGNKLFYSEFSDELTEENVSDVKASLGMYKRGCHGCENFNFCPMPCWSSIIFEHYKVGECPLKRAYSYITDEHMNDYKQWRENNNVFK